MLLQVMDGSDGLDADDEPETHLWTRRLSGELVTLRISRVKQHAYLEWPDGVPFDQDTAVSIAEAMDEALIRQVRYAKRCPRTKCTCGKTTKDQWTMNTDPCAEVQRKVAHAVVVSSTRVVQRFPMIGYRRDRKPFIEFELTRAYFANPACRFLYQRVDEMARKEARWNDVEVNCIAQRAMQLTDKTDVF